MATQHNHAAAMHAQLSTVAPMSRNSHRTSCLRGFMLFGFLSQCNIFPLKLSFNARTPRECVSLNNEARVAYVENIAHRIQIQVLNEIAYDHL